MALYGISLIVTRVMYKHYSARITMKDGLEAYCYFNKNDTSKVYGIENMFATHKSTKIDMMLSYYNYKFKGSPYKYSDISFIASIPNNKKVLVQDYFRDSSIVLIAYPDLDTLKTRLIAKKFYVPSYILHEKPIIEK